MRMLALSRGRGNLKERRPQKMFIMNLVWPITALYFSVFALWFYFRIGRPMGLAIH